MILWFRAHCDSRAKLNKKYTASLSILILDASFDIKVHLLVAINGKGAPDGIGAVIKRTADCSVRFGKDIGTLKDFWLVMKEKIKNVEMRIVTRKDIEDKRVTEKLNAFKGTMKVHQVLRSSRSLKMT